MSFDACKTALLNVPGKRRPQRIEYRNNRLSDLGPNTITWDQCGRNVFV